MASLTLNELEQKTLKELYCYAREYKISYYSQMNKKELVLAVLRAQAEQEGFYYMKGVLDIVSRKEGYGFLRPINYSASKEDIYISSSQIRHFDLRVGDLVAGKVRLPKPGERYYGLMHVDSVNGKPPEEAKKRSHFPALTPIYPNHQLKLETSSQNLASRVVDLFAPLGLGQRGMIVAPPKAGKTTLLKQIAWGISANYPEAKLIVLLIDERPEEVTDLERCIDGEVIYSTFDKSAENHIKIAELVLQRAMRLVEDKQDVVILLDSLTRLARAYNLVVPPSGRTLSGGIDPAALYPPKKFFGAARNIEEGGSLTILATALIETGSRMDDVIYEEFKGTGNQELHLLRQLAEKRIFPAIDLQKSSTRKEELLFDAKVREVVYYVRQNFDDDPEKATQKIFAMLQKTKDNEQFCQCVTLLQNSTQNKKR